MKVAICILTYKRPHGIERLLRGICAMTTPESVIPVLIIVDNDPSGSAQSIVEDTLAGENLRFAYIVEKRPGIAVARNTAMEHAPETDWIAFIDDDEVPEPSWLNELIRAQRQFQADVITGPVMPRYETEPARWVVAGRFFERRRYASGTQLNRAYTNNVMFRAKILDDTGLRFDEHLSLMGGEDQDFFAKVSRAGHRIVWDDLAIVTEWIPKERTTWRWLVRRLLRVGTATCMIERDAGRGWATALWIIFRSGAWSVIGVAQLLTTVVLGRVGLVRALQAWAYAVGLINGFRDKPYEEYGAIRHAQA
ncbi:MAG: glycosyltransferase family 2 protein [Planctomycetota bacterium]|jgi:glycosyltransferase involved in cell wall biosynthesis